MNRCSKCNNELIAGARFCNICGTPVPGAPATPAISTTPGGLKRTINPEIKRVLPPRTDQSAAVSLIPDDAPVEPGTPDNLTENTGSDASEKQEAQEQKQSAPNFSNPPVIPKTTIEYTPI